MSFSFGKTEANKAAAIAAVEAHMVEMVAANSSHALIQTETNAAVAAVVGALEDDPACVVAVNIDGHCTPSEADGARSISLTVRATLIQA